MQALEAPNGILIFVNQNYNSLQRRRIILLISKFESKSENILLIINNFITD